MRLGRRVESQNIDLAKHVRTGTAKKFALGQIQDSVRTQRNVIDVACLRAKINLDW
jgi:hypothetical protein